MKYLANENGQKNRTTNKCSRNKNAWIDVRNNKNEYARGVSSSSFL